MWCVYTIISPSTGITPEANERYTNISSNISLLSIKVKASTASHNESINHSFFLTIYSYIFFYFLPFCFPFTALGVLASCEGVFRCSACGHPAGRCGQWRWQVLRSQSWCGHDRYVVCTLLSWRLWLMFRGCSVTSIFAKPVH